ncbi:tRNA1(Val) (adenine(37)-N6)-methyltransferase [Coralliovum pocilloporae]|uniref:tRNA1(Val) (adenine(37)-N6)-methyltransferase n=1 Tax=Coralliovum pocilloporae TaxID=3066369 RepID=UPI003306E328
MSNTTIDAFLGDGLAIEQPRNGAHRSGIDAVLLAAAVPAKPGDDVVDLGSGVGVAGLCVAARVGQVNLTLVERDADAAFLARSNLERSENSRHLRSARVLETDVTQRGGAREAAGLVPKMADHVLLNPPYYRPGEVRQSPNEARARAHVLTDEGIEPWIRTACALLKPRGTVTVIFRADGLMDLVSALSGRVGDIRVLPLHPEPGQPAYRIIVHGIQGSRAPLSLLPGFTLHEGANKTFVKRADDIMRFGARLSF